MDNLKVLGIDLVKNIFQLHGTDKQGSPVITKRLSRKNLLPYLGNLPPCLVGIEACGSAYYWAREFIALGHEVKIMTPKYVKSYITSNKNDANDAEAIAEAVTRPKAKFVSLKSLEQQDIQTIHRIREQLIKQRTAIVNQIRGLLAEYGITIPKGISHIRKQFIFMIEDASNHLSRLSRELFYDLYEQFKAIDARASTYDKRLETISKEDERCQRLMTINGIGPISATAMIAAVGNANVFKNGRHLAAFIGLVPKQRSSGNKIILQGISKRGNRYLRRLLIHGARAVIMRHADKKTDKQSVWIADKKAKSNFNATSVALANKIARYAWVVLAKNEAHSHNYV